MELGNDYFLGTIIDNTGRGATTDPGMNEMFRTALGKDGQGKLSEAFADLFSMEPVTVNNETRVIIDFVEDK